MNFFNRGKGYGGRDRKKNNNRGREERKMYKGICDECGRTCDLPFRPTGDKPVYCSACFKPRELNDNRDRRNDRQMHKAVCDECGRSCEVPFKPSKGKEIFCNDCFGRNDSFGRKDTFDRGGRQPKRDNFASNQSAEKHGLILAKLDKIISLLEKNQQFAEKIKEEKPVKKTASKKEEKQEKVAEEKVEKKTAKKTKKAKSEKKVTKKTAVKKKEVKAKPAKKTTTKKKTK